MRTKNELLMGNIIAEIDKYYSKYCMVPSTRELAQILAVSHNTVARYLRDMVDSGMLICDGERIATPRISKSKPDGVTVPILGSISCGTPLTAEENVESYVRLPVDLTGQGEFFFVRANGDSMIEAGIEHGDLVLVRKTAEAKDGDIVVALVDDENTLKRIYFDSSNNMIILHPENRDMSDITVSGCEIQGVAVKVIKDI